MHLLDMMKRLDELIIECEKEVLIADTLMDKSFWQGKETAYLELFIEVKKGIRL